MSKKQIQEGKQGGDDEREFAKSRPARNLVSMTLNRSPTVPSSSSSHSPRNLTENCSTLDSLRTSKLVAMDSNKNNASSSLVVAPRFYPELQHDETCGKIEKDYRLSKFVPSQLGKTAKHCRVFGGSLHT